MHDREAQRLIDAGLYVPGWSNSDITELMKARQARNWPVSQNNRGTFFSDYGDDWNYWGAGSHERKPMTTIAFTTLRDRYRNSPIDKLIVMRRQMQVRRVANRCLVPGKQVGFRVVHERHADPSYVPSPETLERCALMERLILNVTRDVCRDFKQFISMEVKEELCIDRKVMVKHLDTDTEKPLAYSPIDGSTVQPRIAVLLPYMLKNKLVDPRQAADQMSQELEATGVRDSDGKKIDVTKAAWIQVVNEEVKGAWTKEEMSVDVVNRDIELDQVLYGKSCLEQSLELTDLFINALMYNMNIFTPNFPEGFISILGAYDKQGVEGFKRTILMQTNASGSQRIPVIPGDDPTFKVEYQKLRDTPKDALFAELMRIVIDMKTAAYGMHPSEINFSPDGGGQVAVINEEDSGQAQEASTQDGFNSILDNMAGWLTEALVRPYFDDLIVIWDGLSTDDEGGRVDLNQQKVQSYATLGEVRGTENAFPLVIPDDISKLDVTKIPLNPVLANLLQLKLSAQQQNMQMQQMAQQQQLPQPPPDADYGQEDGSDWHKAGQPPQMDYGSEEPPNWFMAGQKDANGDTITMGKLRGKEQAKKKDTSANKSQKYLTVTFEDSEGNDIQKVRSKQTM